MADAGYYSTIKYPGNGVQTVFEISFAGGYLSKDHVKAYIEGPTLAQTVIGFTWVSDFTIKADRVTPVGSTLVVYRSTPNDKPIADFTDGAIITEGNLDINARQAVFLAAETRDIVGAIPNLAALQSAQLALAFATNRVNQTGVQAIATVDGLQPILDSATGITNRFTNAAAISGEFSASLQSQANMRFGLLGVLQPLWGYGFENNTQQLFIGSTVGRAAMVGFTRSSDNPSVGDMGTYSLGAFTEHNSDKYAWGIYTEVRRRAGAGSAHGQEICMANFGETNSYDPYTVNQTAKQTDIMRLGSGRTDRPSNDISGYLDILNTGARGVRGITFGNDALTMFSGQADAINMATGHTIQWWAAAGQRGPRIRSDTTAQAKAMAMIFADNQIALQDANAVTSVSISPTGISLPSLGSATVTSPRFNMIHDSYFSTAFALNDTARIKAHKWAGGADTRITALSVSAEDHMGWNGTGGGNPFAEAIKGEATAQANGASIYGGVFIASIPLGVTAKYAIGCEPTVVNNNVDAAQAFSSASFSAACMATNGLDGGSPAKIADAAFLVNPLSKANFQRGFYVAGSVSFSAFEAQGTMQIGLNLSGATPSYAAIVLGDGAGSVVRGGAAKGNMLSVSGAALSLGYDATSLGFFGSTPVAKPTITGSRGSNAALTALLTALASQGLITNSTST